MDKLAISILAFIRPTILKQCLDSLAANNDLKDVDIHLWLDGGKGVIKGLEASADMGNLDVFNDSKFAVKYAHTSPVNLGYSGQYARIFPTMMADYKQFVVLDDDVIWGSHTVAIMRKLLDQFRDDARVGGINPGMKRYCAENMIEQNWDTVILSRGNTRSLCTECYWSDKMVPVWRWYSQYMEVIKPWSYWQLPHADARAAVREWAESIGSDMTEVSPDTAMVRSINMAGMQRMVTVLNRATNIGDLGGVHCTPEALRQLGIGHQPILESEAELAIEKFRVIEEHPKGETCER